MSKMSKERIRWGLDEQGEWARFAVDSNGNRRSLTPTENADRDKAQQVRWLKWCKTMRTALRKYESGTVRPRFTARYLQYVAWAEGRDPAYAPTMADLLLLASERRARMGKPPRRSPADTRTPSDTISVGVALSKFTVDRSTLRRAREDRRLRSYRPPNAPKNASHQYSDSELAALYPRR